MTQSDRILAYIDRCGSITQAAQQLCLTQPSVSKHIQSLEQALGCPLFLRSKRGGVLTAEGRALMSKLEPACKLIFAAEQELRSLARLASLEGDYEVYPGHMESSTLDYERRFNPYLTALKARGAW